MDLSTGPGPDRYDVCIVGAGIAGLNAAFVATTYLPAHAKVLLLDKHPQPGGMWHDTYSYVRLHQPYRYFTVGDIPWRLRRERQYLANREEVAAHLGHCLAVLAGRFDLDARWGWECVDEVEQGDTVLVTARDPGGGDHQFRAARLVHAPGWDVEVIEPLPLSSSQVGSISPHQVEHAGLLTIGNEQPVCVVGSGKTAMDTVHSLVQANPHRHVSMVTGTGTYFIDRDRSYPTGSARWWAGSRPTATLTAIARRFDGTNAGEVAEWFRPRYGTLPIDPAYHCLFAWLSRAEAATISNGLSEVVRDHLIDVVDEPDGPRLSLRSGATHPVRAGTWIVNCTGYLNPRHMAHRPYVSRGGRMMSVNPSSAVTGGTTSIAGYFLAHLFFADRLRGVPLYELDLNALRRTAPDAGFPVIATHMMHNFSVFAEHVPMSAFQHNGLDLDRWYPLPRRLAGLVQFMSTHKRDRNHHRNALDTFSQQTGVRCGLLNA